MHLKLLVLQNILWVWTQFHTHFGQQCDPFLAILTLWVDPLVKSKLKYVGESFGKKSWSRWQAPSQIFSGSLLKKLCCAVSRLKHDFKQFSCTLQSGGEKAAQTSLVKASILLEECNASFNTSAVKYKLLYLSSLVQASILEQFSTSFSTWALQCSSVASPHLTPGLA